MIEQEFGDLETEEHCTYGVEVVVFFEARLVFGAESWSNSTMIVASATAAWTLKWGGMGSTVDGMGGVDSGAATATEVLSAVGHKGGPPLEMVQTGRERRWLLNVFCGCTEEKTDEGAVVH